MSQIIELDVGDGVGGDQKGDNDLPIVQFDRFDTLTTDDTQRPNASRVTTRTSTHSSLGDTRATILRFLKKFLTFRAKRKHVKCPMLLVGIPDLTSDVVKDPTAPSIANGAFATIYRSQWSHDKRVEMVSLCLVERITF